MNGWCDIWMSQGSVTYEWVKAAEGTYVDTMCQSSTERGGPRIRRWYVQWAVRGCRRWERPGGIRCASLLPLILCHDSFSLGLMAYGLGLKHDTYNAQVSCSWSCAMTHLVGAHGSERLQPEAVAHPLNRSTDLRTHPNRVVNLVNRLV